MQWGHFVCPSSSQKRESTAFDLILRNAWGLSSMLVEVVLHVRKGAKFGVEKVNGGQNICNRVASVGNEKNFENKLSPLRVKAPAYSRVPSPSVGYLKPQMIINYCILVVNKL